MKNISILGSTGSIGTQTIEVIKNLDDCNILGLAANSNINLLEKQIRQLKPKIVAVFNEEKAKILKDNIRDTDTKVFSGMDGLIQLSTNNKNDVLVVSVNGLVGLTPTLEAIKNKIDIALATKEIMVSAGHLVMNTAKHYGVNIVPIDSEHCAIKQCLKDNYKQKLNKIILTASGGPFRGKKLEELRDVTVQDALCHPNWNMGKKISIDSATLMNKGLEVIEARWLFDVGPEKIDVVVHPQSIIHSMVEYIDGTIIAQMSKVDMRIPIHYAITYPETLNNSFGYLNLYDKNLSFEKPDVKTFKLLELSYKSLKIGGTMPVVLNSANEIAVNLFLQGKIKFLDIQNLVEECMKTHDVTQEPQLEEILQTDLWAKNIINDMVN